VPPDGTTAVPALYGITKDPDVIANIRAMTASLRDRLNEAIDNLQSNPFPPGHTAYPNNMQLYKFVVETTPKYQISYAVDTVKEKVFIVALQEKRFS